MVTEEQVERFMRLFNGNLRSFGQYNPRMKVQMLTVKAEYTTEHVRSHLEGEIGLGIVPIRDDNTCMFAAIDIDIHGPNGSAVDVMELEQKNTRLALPLVVCRSKSGGAHCYLFLKTPVSADRVRIQLARWAAQLGYASAEIFPKQITLDRTERDPEQPLGNWINLPYMAIAETNRYAVDGGKQVSYEYFLEIAEGRRVDLSEYEQQADADYLNGPPCLQKMIKDNVDEGNRNTAVFQAGVYLKRAFPEDWNNRLLSFNQVAMLNPLNQREIKIIARSVGRKDYQYKCREEPCKSFCDKELCKTREFGITASDTSATEIPLIDKVEKVIATPIRWALTIKGEVVEVTTPQLFNVDLVRQAVGEKLHIVMPRIKNAEWDQYLREILAKVEIRKEMTMDDMIFQRLCEYLRRVRVDKSRPEEERRKDLQRGAPSVICISQVTFKAGQVTKSDAQLWYYAFKITDFIEYLRRKKALSIPDHAMATYLTRILGEDAKRDKMRVGSSGRITNIWCVPEEVVDNEKVPEKEFDEEY